VNLKFDHLPVNASAVLGICEPASCILTQQLNIASMDFIGTQDWQLCSARSLLVRHMSEPRISSCTSKLLNDAFFILSTSKCVHSLRFPVHLQFETDK